MSLRGTQQRCHYSPFVLCMTFQNFQSYRAESLALLIRWVMAVAGLCALDDAVEVSAA